MLERYGLASVAGGVHPSWGTANRIVPLGEGYLELLACTDADAHPFGRVIAERAEAGGPAAWCISTDDLDSVAARLGLTLVPGERELPDGGRLTWRLAGVQEAFVDPSLPFFIAWDGPPDAHPGRAHADNSVEPISISWIEAECDRDKISRWLGDEDLDVRISAGSKGLTAVGISTKAGELIVSL